MQSPSTARDRLWDDRQRDHRMRKDLDRAQWRKHFALVFGLILLTLAVARAVAGLGAGGSIKL